MLFITYYTREYATCATLASLELHSNLIKTQICGVVRQKVKEPCETNIQEKWFKNYDYFHNEKSRNASGNFNFLNQ